jgi:hypothetical protein
VKRKTKAEHTAYMRQWRAKKGAEHRLAMVRSLLLWCEAIRSADIRSVYLSEVNRGMRCI